MEVCIAYMRDKPVVLRLEDDVVYIDGEALPMKGVDKAMLEDFAASIAAIPYSSDEDGYKALLNARRAAFLSNLLGCSVGDECVDKISAILDSVHYEVLLYLGEIEEE